MRRLLTFLAFALLLPFGSARAQGLDIGLVQGRDGALPITVVPMPYLGTSVAPDTDIAAVIRADLNRSGQFNALSEQDGQHRANDEDDLRQGRTLRHLGDLFGHRVPRGRCLAQKLCPMLR